VGHGQTICQGLSRAMLITSLVISIAAFTVLLMSLLGQFISRALFNTGLIWSDELARLCFVWCSFFGAVVAWQTQALHRIDMLMRRLTSAWRTLFERLVQTMISIALVYLLWYGLAMLQRALDQTTETLEISGAWLYLPIPVMAAMMLVVTWLPKEAQQQKQLMIDD
jgi:TRAP-type C4-dicarboxylate transport system permease small subunit